MMPALPHRLCLHASCVALDGRGVLLIGPSGIGKSDIALQLVDRGAALVSDDQTEIWAEGEALFAAPPAPLRGLLEIRPVGLLRLPFREEKTPLSLCVALREKSETLERLPEASFQLLLDRKLPKIDLPGRASSTPAIIRAVLKWELLS